MNESGTLAQNEYVRELLGLLEDNGKDSLGLSALLEHMSEMENFARRAEEKIADMKAQLAEIKEIQGHPVKTALFKAIKALEQKAAAIRAQIGELKTAIADGCKGAAAAFKANGLSALDKLASFFRLKEGFAAIDRGAQAQIAVCDQAIARTEAYYSEFYRAGRVVKNMARILGGKKPLPTRAEGRRLENIALAPYKAEKALNLQIRARAGAALARLERLNERAAESRAHRVRDKEPLTLLGEVREAQQLVAQRQREMPAPERGQVKATEI
jgi:regulator of replication initiation timing